MKCTGYENENDELKKERKKKMKERQMWFIPASMNKYDWKVLY